MKTEYDYLILVAMAEYGGSFVQQLSKAQGYLCKLLGRVRQASSRK
jgi:hypothetical protein